MGSTLDITKAVGALLNNPGPAFEYRGFDQLGNPGVSTVCIPSTAGTGSEVTHNASFVDFSEGRKMGINGLYMTASCGVLDAEWIMSCPYPVALSTGMDDEGTSLAAASQDGPKEKIEILAFQGFVGHVRRKL